MTRIANEDDVDAAGVVGRAGRRRVRPSHPVRTEGRTEQCLTLGSIAGVCVAHHAVLIGEAYVMIHALGANPTFATVAMFEGATKTANTVGTIVPGRLGIAEGGAAAMAGALGIGASYGLAVVLMRRVRALLWSIVGVPLVVPELWRMSRSPGERRI
jgi:hypothetical protein